MTCDHGLYVSLKPNVFVCPICEIERLRATLKEIEAALWATPEQPIREIARRALMVDEQIAPCPRCGEMQHPSIPHFCDGELKKAGD